jgi:hypothetical protein
MGAADDCALTFRLLRWLSLSVSLRSACSNHNRNEGCCQESFRYVHVRLFLCLDVIDLRFLSVAHWFLFLQLPLLPPPLLQLQVRLCCQSQLLSPLCLSCYDSKQFDVLSSFSLLCCRSLLCGLFLAEKHLSSCSRCCRPCCCCYHQVCAALYALTLCLVSGLALSRIRSRTHLGRFLTQSLQPLPRPSSMLLLTPSQLLSRVCVFELSRSKTTGHPGS